MSETPNLLPLLYAIDGTYGWSKGMRAISHALLTGLPQSGPFLEIGCGAGHFLREYAERYPNCTVVGTDIHPVALAHAQCNRNDSSTAFKLARSDLQRLPFPDNTFTLMAAFDVYDQEGIDIPAALVESRRVLQSNGVLLLRVSAYPWLEGDHDRAFNTAHRFHRQAIIKALHVAGFCPIRVTYANMVLALPVIALRLAQRWGLLAYETSIYTSPLHNWLMAQSLCWEAAHLARHNLPFGISLYVLARKEV